MTTTEQLVYAGAPQSSDNPTFVKGDGDGTVNLRSLKVNIIRICFTFYKHFVLRVVNAGLELPVRVSAV